MKCFASIQRSDIHDAQFFPGCPSPATAIVLIDGDDADPSNTDFPFSFHLPLCERHYQQWENEAGDIYTHIERIGLEV